MIEPIKDYFKIKRTYLFGVPTFYNNFHTGVDLITKIGTPILAWDDDLEVTHAFSGKDGGNTIWVKIKGNKRLFRFLHLDKPGKVGKFKKGDIIGYTGNTGKSTGPHVHIDISKNGELVLTNNKNFEDPDAYFKSAINLKPDVMTNAKIVSKKGSKEVGIYLPMLSEEALLSAGANFGLDIPAKGKKVDWAKLKIDGEVTIK